MELQDKVAIVTGASGGIGEAIVHKLDEAGMKLILTARSQDKLNSLAAKLQAAKAVAGDATDADLPQKLLDTALQTFGQVDVVINNAGVMTVGAIEEINIDKICQMVRINVESVYRMSYVALKHFKQTGSGFIVNMSSIAGLKTSGKYPAYCGTKFALEAFTDSLRMELAGADIGIACVEPGTVDTGLYDHWDKDQKDAIAAGGMLQPEEVAYYVRFILEQPAHILIPRLLVVPSRQPV